MIQFHQEGAGSANNRAGGRSMNEQGSTKPIASVTQASESFLAQLRRVNTERYEAWAVEPLMLCAHCGRDQDGARAAGSTRCNPPFLAQEHVFNVPHSYLTRSNDAGIMFDAVELGGEVGELLNVVKKLEREDRGWRGSRAGEQDFADECADVLICLDKLARRRGVDLEAATIRKFNATSEKNGFPHRLAAEQSCASTPAVGREAIERTLERLRWALGHVSIDAMEGDNLAITLCTRFEDADGEQDENGWTEAAVKGCDATLAAIHALYADAILALHPPATSEADRTCSAAPDHADIMETIENAAPDWQKQGYASALAEVRDMANVGRALMEALPEGYHYMDCPSEIVCDLQNKLDEALATEQATSEADRIATLEAENARLRLRDASEFLAAMELWFTRDLSETQRRHFCNVMGFPGVEANSLNLQLRILRHVMSALAMDPKQ